MFLNLKIMKIEMESYYYKLISSLIKIFHFFFYFQKNVIFAFDISRLIFHES